MKITPKRGVGAVVGAWVLVKAQEFIAYTGTVDAVDWSAVGVTAVSELMTAAVALIALFTQLEPVKSIAPTPRLTETLPPEIDDEPILAPFNTDTNKVTTLKEPKSWFSDAELSCKCQDEIGCDYRGMHPTVLAMANELRNIFGPIVVTSAYRCPEHNRKVGGSSDSYHVKGMAIDMKSPTIEPRQLYEYLDAKYPKQYGIGLYKTFIHLDSRTGAWARKTSADSNWRQFEHTSTDLAVS